MIGKGEYEAIKAKIDRHEVPEPEELDALMEYEVAEADARLAANPVIYKCQHCGADAVISQIREIVVCEYCGKELLMDGFQGEA